ncbi:MarR family winged helix-turn-helix transcriptional regulator [Flavobacterium sp. J27]|uniref:MarR family winged helix-turn-helix transcriptional regulator n=1 Tax=Flavobacterium sp. J27 TaxID=2060419 RepID=UPI001032442B|nr:MarR family transcriptional regulator [Flavobacterium sp. J27]
MDFVTPTKTVLYTIEKTIKEYRKFAQINISKKVSNITIDQALVLLLINENPDSNQKELAHLIFKDYASMTRIIELLVKRGYLERTTNVTDRRRHNLILTKKGKHTIEVITPIIESNRKEALAGLLEKQIAELHNTLHMIINNCTKPAQ